MCDVNPMFHMDSNYDWRWYTTRADGSLSAMSAESFFDHAAAVRDFDAAQRRPLAPQA